MKYQDVHPACACAPRIYQAAYHIVQLISLTHLHLHSTPQLLPHECVRLPVRENVYIFIYFWGENLEYCFLMIKSNGYWLCHISSPEEWHLRKRSAYLISDGPYLFSCSLRIIHPLEAFQRRYLWFSFFLRQGLVQKG